MEHGPYVDKLWKMEIFEENGIRPVPEAGPSGPVPAVGIKGRDSLAGSVGPS